MTCRCRFATAAILASAFTACVLTILAGCQLAGVVLSAMPPPDIPARYEIADQPTLIFVDDPADIVPALPLMGQIAHHAGLLLKNEKVVTQIIDPSSVDALRFKHSDFSTWSVTRVGQELGAKQVIYVMVERFQLVGPDQFYEPVVWMRVKLIDVQSGRRLFPEQDGPGDPVQSAVMLRKTVESGTPGGEQALSRQLAQQAGEDVARVFFKHQPPNFAKNYPQ
jgi:hypothetical protein